MEVIKVPVKNENEKVRVAVYCRVSTKGDDQEDSLELQQDYYKKLIQTRSDWALVGVYADERSGLNAEKRPQFMQMINDALDGKIDRILCKSVSRFSRNAAECRKYTDMLKMKNVFVEFEKENIRTDDPTSSLIFSLASAVADSESRSISDNVKWGFQQRYKRGEYKLGNNRILGYDTVDGKLVPNKDAWAIKKIYNDYLEGKKLKQIANELGEMGVISRTGRPYLPQTIDYILSYSIALCFGGELFFGHLRGGLFLTPRHETVPRRSSAKPLLSSIITGGNGVKKTVAKKTSSGLSFKKRRGWREINEENSYSINDGIACCNAYSFV